MRSQSQWRLRAGAAMLWLMALFAGMQTAGAGKQDFVLVNETGVEIHELYISRSKSDEWEEDVLGVETLPDGESVEITFPAKQKGSYWDLRVVDEDGNFVEWERLKLSEISKLTLYIKKGEVYAETE